MTEDHLKLLRSKGYKLTPQRRAVLDAFHECDPFPTAQQLLATVRKKHSNVSLDTIYRNLALLSNLGDIH